MIAINHHHYDHNNTVIMSFSAIEKEYCQLTIYIRLILEQVIGQPIPEMQADYLRTLKIYDKQILYNYRFCFFCNDFTIKYLFAYKDTIIKPKLCTLRIQKHKQSLQKNYTMLSNLYIIIFQQMPEFLLPAQVTNEDITITIVLALFLFIYIARSYFRPAKCSITRIPIYLNIVLTGGSTGIGKSLLKKLSQYQCEITVFDIDEKQFQRTLDDIQKTKNKKCYIKFIKADLSDPKSIQDAISQMSFGNVNVLINNAGILAPKTRILNSQGIQIQMAVNYLGHCRMIFGLLSKLQASREFKIINIGSSAHKYPPLSFQEVSIDFKDFQNVRNNYYPFMSYSKSKLCLAGFTVMMGYELQMRNIRGKIIYVHPGFARSSIGRYQLNGLKRFLFLTIYPLFYTIISRSCDESADTILYLILEKYDSIKNGAYYNDNKIDTYSTRATDKDFQKQLWKKTLSYVKGAQDWKLEENQQKSI